jgi:nucleotide-binding universal stress UspA family protein
MRHALLGSVAEEVVRRSDVPVLTVHAEGQLAPLASHLA